MDISGSTREGWMAFIPAVVLVLIVVYVLGGPAQFMNLVSQWSEDITTSVVKWVRHL